MTWREELQDRRVRAVGALLCLGCYHSLWQWSQRGGLFAESIPRFELLLPPWVGAWRLHLLGSAFNTVGMMWVVGMISLVGMFLMLAGGGGSLPAVLLGLALVFKAFFYSADFRLWSGYENAHFLLGALFLLCRPRLAAVRAGLAIAFMVSGLTQAVNTGVSLTAAWQLIAPSLWWLLPWTWVATAGLTAMLVWQGLHTGAEFVMVLAPCLLLVGNCRELVPRSSWALLVPAAGLGFLAGLGHPQMALDPQRPEVKAVYQVWKGTDEWQLEVRIKLVGPGERRVMVTLSQAPGWEGQMLRSAWSPGAAPGGVESSSSSGGPEGGTVLVQPRYFQQAELAVQDPYLYLSYADELRRRYQPDALKLELTCGSRQRQDWSWGTPPPSLSPGGGLGPDLSR